MDNDTIILSIIASMALCFALVNCVCFLVKKNRTALAVGTVISVRMPNPETAKARNSKWAKISYRVNGKSYQSQNRIQVPMASQIGTQVTVRYDIANPERLYSFSGRRILMSLSVAVICILAVLLKL